MIVKDAREAIDFLDEVRREKRLSYKRISVGMPGTGQRYYRMYSKDDVRLSWFIQFLDTVGYDMIIQRREEA